MDKLYMQRQWRKKHAVLTCPECGHTGAKVLATDHYRNAPARAVNNEEFYILHCKCEQCGIEYEVKV